MGLIHSEFGQHFAVNSSAVVLEAGHELGIGEAFGASGVVDAGNPERAQVAFAVAAIAVGIAQGFDDALFGEAEAAGAVMLHAFGSVQNFLVFGPSGHATFDSHD